MFLSMLVAQVNFTSENMFRKVFSHHRKARQCERMLEQQVKTTACNGMQMVNKYMYLQYILKTWINEW